MKRLRMRLAVLVGVAALLILVASGTVFAAGEQLRSTFANGGGTVVSSNGQSLRSVVGLWASGSSISSSSGAGLCTGFGCSTRTNSSDGGSSGDSDGDGVPDSSDPNDSDPCVPNPDASNCSDGGSSSSKKLYLPNLRKPAP